MPRKSFKASADDRAKVRQLSGIGMPHDDIAKIVGCSPKTLRKHFRRELDLGAAEANATVAGYLFQNAKNGNVAAQIFWMKTRAHWREAPVAVEQNTAEGASSAEADQAIVERMKERLKRFAKRPESEDEPQ